MAPNSTISEATSQEDCMDTGRSSRSRLGCQTCRDKKVKCDEQQPQCRRCIRLNRECNYMIRPRKKYSRRNQSSRPDRASGVEAQSSSLDVANRPNRTAVEYQKTLTNQSDAIVDTEGLSEGSACLAPLEINSLPLNSSSPYPETPLSAPHPLVLSEYDHEAIHYVRFEMAHRVDTKPPQYSGPALVWTLAQKSPMVLHMICALGLLQLCRKSPHCSTIPSRVSEAMTHYAAGLRLLAVAIDNLAHTSDLDFILATLWLMISYELVHGGATGAGLSVHLRGAAVLLQGQLKNLRNFINSPNRLYSATTREIETKSSFDDGNFGITRVTSQLLLWIAIVDGSAALNGINAAFNHMLGEAMHDLADNETSSRLRGFRILQQYATLVNQEVWGSDYPQNEVIEDLQCSQIFSLQAETGQLRYMLSKVADHAPHDEAYFRRELDTLAHAIQDVASRYEGLLTTARLVELSKAGLQRRFVLNLCTIVPFYYGVVLLFSSLYESSGALSDRQRLAMREIMTLAFEAYTVEGDQAVYKISWPLFIVALESDDMIHRAWILDRFGTLAREGENLRRAHAALISALSRQRPHKRPVRYMELLRHSNIEPFVLE
ncbi:hypothetical protein N7451_006040 [Penicillium sp. IBT 35674x]|nr:hypothetical protein N7451_006040 [Penicillium sp. IBT 35674x]